MKKKYHPIFYSDRMHVVKYPKSSNKLPHQSHACAILFVYVCHVELRMCLMHLLPNSLNSHCTTFDHTTMLLTA
jgi:hypothetical protein